MTDTTTPATVGTCRLTGRVVDATGHPHAGAVITLTPLPPLPASPGDVPALVAPARLDLDADGRITSPDPDTGLTQPWATVITGPWTTRVRLVGAGTTWVVDTRLPAGQTVDITSLVPDAQPIDPDDPPQWAAQVRADLDALTTRLDDLAAQVADHDTGTGTDLSAAVEALTTRLTAIEEGPYDVWAPAQSDPSMGYGTTDPRQTDRAEMIRTLTTTVRDIGSLIRPLAAEATGESMRDLSQAVVGLIGLDDRPTDQQETSLWAALTAITHRLDALETTR